MQEHYYGVFLKTYTPTATNWNTVPMPIVVSSTSIDEPTLDTDYWVVECFELNADAARETVQHGVLFGTKEDYHQWYAQNISTISPPDIDLMRRRV